MDAMKEWSIDWLDRCLEENDNGTVTATLDDSEIRLHFVSTPAAEAYLMEHKLEEAFIDVLAHEADVAKDIRKYGQ